MALTLADRVQETTTTAGTGTITLAGAVAGYQAFSSIGNGNTTYYAITSGTAWEVGIGTYTLSGTTLSRDTVLSSSNAGAKISLTSLSNVFVTYPAERAITEGYGTLPVANGGTGATIAATARTNLSAAASGANTDITSVTLTSGTITTTPTSGTDIVNKTYADTIASGINFHQSVRLATVAALPANTYNNGTSGVGATLTANANGALSVDGVAVVATNRILVKNEVTQANNGVYTVTQVGDGSTPYILTRATDFDSAGAGVDQIDAGDFFLVTAGSTLTNTSWVQQTPLPITVGTTAIVFLQFGAPITYSAGTGLTLAGTVFSLTAPVTVALGGTGATDAATALTNLGAYPASNPNGYTSNTGTVTSVGGTGTVNGITLTGSVTSSGNLTLGGTLSNVDLASQITGTLPAANGGTGITSSGTVGNVLTSNGTTWVSQAPAASGVTQARATALSMILGF
jgi:hypothetical protein